MLWWRVESGGEREKGHIGGRGRAAKVVVGEGERTHSDHINGPPPCGRNASYLSYDILRHEMASKAVTPTAGRCW